MDLITSIKDKFIEEITNAIALHKLLIILIFILFYYQFAVIKTISTISVISENKTITESTIQDSKNIKITKEEILIEKNILKKHPEKITEIKNTINYWDDPHSIWRKICCNTMKEIFSTDSGIVTKITLLNILFSIVTFYVFSCVFNVTQRKLFDFFAFISDLKKYLSELKSRSKVALTDSDYMNFILAQSFETQLSDKSGHIKKISSFSEVLFNLSLISLISIFFGFYLDVLISIGLFVVSIFFQFLSFKYYLSQYLPIIVTIKVLKNENVEILNKI